MASTIFNNVKLICIYSCNELKSLNSIYFTYLIGRTSVAMSETTNDNMQHKSMSSHTVKAVYGHQYPGPLLAIQNYSYYYILVLDAVQKSGQHLEKNFKNSWSISR